MAKKIRNPKPYWVENRRHWRLNTTINGERRIFYSSLEGQAGYRECKAKFNEALEIADVEEIRFALAWKLYVEYYRGRYKETSARALERTGDAHFLPALGHKKVSRIKKAEWQRVIDNAYKNGARSYRSLRRIGSNITTFCKWAAGAGYLPDDKVPLYFNYPTTKLTRKKTILQPEQLALLLSDQHTHDDWYMQMWRFLVLTGLRRGELCALRYDRDFDGESIYIRESLDHDHILTDGKTIQAKRHIVLAPLAKQQILDHEERLRANGKNPDERKYLFCTPFGRVMPPRQVSYYWREWRKKNDITITLHELRHTYISYSRLKTEIDLKELKELYGHSASMKTDKVYVHAIDMSPEEKRAKLMAAKKNVEDIERSIVSVIRDVYGNG